MSAPAEAPLTLQLGSTWNERVREASLSPAELAAPVGDALAALAAAFGIPAPAELHVEADSPTGALRLLLDGEPLLHPADLAERTLGTPHPAGDPSRELPRVAAEIAKLHLERLLHPAGVAACLETLPLDAGGVPPERAGRIFRGLLGRGISLAGRAALARGLGEAARLGLPDDDAEELLAARLAARAIDVEIHPDYARELFGLELPPGEPRPVRALDAGAAEPFARVEQELFSELGLRLPPVRLLAEESLPPRGFAVRINQLAGAPWSGSLEETASRPWQPVEYLCRALGVEVRRRAADLVGVEVVEYELALLATEYPDVVAAVQECVSTARLCAILRTLLRGGVSIRDLRGILERVVGFSYVAADTRGRIVLSDHLVVDERLLPGAEEGPEGYARYVRRGLARAITQRVAGGGGVLPVCMLDHERAEIPLYRHLVHLAGGADGAPLAPEELERILHAVRDEVDLAAPAPPVLLVDDNLAAFLREALVPGAPDLRVLAYEDLAPDLAVQVVARIAP